LNLLNNIVKNFYFHLYQIIFKMKKIKLINKEKNENIEIKIKEVNNNENFGLFLWKSSILLCLLFKEFHEKLFEKNSIILEVHLVY
jgi:hypothetical protein